MARRHRRLVIAELVAGTRVLVAGAGITGRAVLAALLPLGARVVVCDDDDDALERVAAGGAEVRSTARAAAEVSGFDLVVVSPGFPPSAPLLVAAASAGVEVWGDVELAWRLDASGRFGPPRRWLAVTGTNGKTTTTSMLQAIMVAAGRSSVMCGNIGNPVLEALNEPAEWLVVELSSFQLHWAPSLRPAAGVVLNVAEDHLDWHGSFDHYAAAKARVLEGQVAIGGVDDPVAARLLADAPAPVRAGFRLGPPGVRELGVRDGMLVDRAFGGPGGQERSDEGTSPGGAAEVQLLPASAIGVPGPVGLLDALGAAAMARAVGVPAGPIADALAAFRVGPHRAELVTTLDGVAFVDDSKATNPHAAAASIAAYPRVVWVAGGLLKGASVEDLVTRVADRLVGVVLVGRDRALVVDALLRHAPNVPVVEVVTREDSGVQGAGGAVVTHVVSEDTQSAESTADRVMAGVVKAARGMASPGDTVLLAPAGASFDQFSGYAHRGDTFAAAVRAASR